MHVANTFQWKTKNTAKSEPPRAAFKGLCFKRRLWPGRSFEMNSWVFYFTQRKAYCNSILDNGARGRSHKPCYFSVSALNRARSKCQTCSARLRWCRLIFIRCCTISTLLTRPGGNSGASYLRPSGIAPLD